MELLEKMILEKGEIGENDVLRVGSFINQRIDIILLEKLAEEFHSLFSGEGVTKIMTVEASGIAIASLTALKFGVPMVYAKKTLSSNVSGALLSAPVHSYTHGNDIIATVPAAYVSPSDRVLFIDDFLAKGSSMNALLSIAEQAGVTIVGAGVIIEKAYQKGGDLLRQHGIRVESLARIASLSTENGITFCK